MRVFHPIKKVDSTEQPRDPDNEDEVSVASSSSEEEDDEELEEERQKRLEEARKAQKAAQEEEEKKKKELWVVLLLLIWLLSLCIDSLLIFWHALFWLFVFSSNLWMFIDMDVTVR